MTRRLILKTGIVVSIMSLMLGLGVKQALSTKKDDRNGDDPNGTMVGVLYLLDGHRKPDPRATMYVDGRWLYDRFGEKVVLRGANSGIAFPGDSDIEELGELAKTGANSARLTFRWLINRSSPEDVDRALTACRDNGLIAIPSVWDATGKWSRLGFCVDFWTTPEMVAVLRKHEAYTLLNIANEAGTRDVTDEEYKHEYEAAIRKLRAAGLHMPLVIDAAHWGREEAYILDNGNYLVDQDPERNLIFDWHPWDTYTPADTNTPYDPEDPAHIAQMQRLSEGIDQAIEQDLCMIIGEFAWQGVFYTKPIAYRHILQYSQKRETGWLYWWWMGNDSHALTNDGVYGDWANAGEEVCITSPNSIANTSMRTTYMQNLATGNFNVPLLSLPAAPTDLAASAGAGARIDLTWQDNSYNELDFFIEIRQHGQQDWLLAKVVPPETEHAVLGGNNSFFTGWSATANSSRIDLTYDTAYDIRVGAYRGYEVVSYSDVVTVATSSDPTTPLSGTGLKGEYFYMEESHPQNFADYTGGPVLTRTDQLIDFDWGTSCPDEALMGVDHFQVRWTGTITPQFSGLYSIYSDSRDFARVFINDELLFDNWFGNARDWYQNSIELAADQNYDIRVEYRAWTGNAWIHVYWASAEIQRQLIPTDRMQPAP